MVDTLYNDWRRDIAAEYVARTGRAFPPMSTERGQKLRAELVAMSDWDEVPDPVDVVDMMIAKGLLLE